MFYAHRSDKYKFIMCTNGRCGSTIVKRWYLKHHGMPTPAIPSQIHNLLQYDDPSLFVSRDEFNEHRYHKFIVVRNPWERLVSFYKTKVVINQSNYEGLGRSSTFRDLVDLVAERGPRDSHTVLQTSQLDGLRFDRVVHLENISTDMREVSRLCRIPWDASDFSDRLYASPVNDSTRKSNRSVEKFAGERLLLDENWPKWREFYTQSSADKISEVYAEDIKRFGYRWKRVGDQVSIEERKDRRA